MASGPLCIIFPLDIVIFFQKSQLPVLVLEKAEQNQVVQYQSKALEFLMQIGKQTFVLFVLQLVFSADSEIVTNRIQDMVLLDELD